MLCGVSDGEEGTTYSDGRRREHVPIVAKFNVARRRQAYVDKPISWDYDRMSKAVQCSEGKGEFLDDLVRAMKDTEVARSVQGEMPDVDAHWRGLVEVLQRVGRRHFQRQNRYDEDEVKWRAERDDLLHRRVVLRSRMTDDWRDKTRLKWLSGRIRRRVRQRHQERLDQRLHDLREAWAHRDLSACHKLAHMIAGRGYTTRRRRVGHLAACQPSKSEWRAGMARPGPMAAWRRSS